MSPATTVTAMRRMPAEDCLWAKPWKGRTILSTGGRSRTMLMERFVPVEAYARTAKAYSPKCLEGVFSKKFACTSWRKSVHVGC